MFRLKLKKHIKNRLIVTTILIVLGIIVIPLGFSYAIFLKNDNLTNINFVAGNLNYKIENSKLTNNSITVDGGEDIKLVLSLTSLNNIESKYELYYLLDGEKKTSEDIEVGYTSESVDSVKGLIKANSKKEITVNIKNKGNKQVSITFGAEGGLVSNELVMVKGNSLDKLILGSDIMLAYTYVGNGQRPSKFPGIDDGYYITDLTCVGGKASWNNDTWTMTITETSDQNISCNASVVDIYKDTSGANKPKLSSGMIPVIYNGTNWVKASVIGEWYNYDEQWWANAVTVSEENRDTYMKATAGTPISMDDINTMWVWIPRFEYETITSTSATEIKVNFLSETESNKTSNYITHPAFTFGNDSLEGIWVAKFEASSDTACTAKGGDIDTGCDLTTLKVNVKPNVTSWRGIRISTIDLNTRAMNDSNNIYGFIESEVDTHAMRNMEWGAVTYLSQSKYGKYGNSNYEGANKEIYQNKSSEYLTGMSNGTPSSSTANTQVAYNIEGTGTGASTTGNIYGVYDMSGGSWEYTMAVMKDNSNNNPMSGNSTTYNSGFTGKLYNSGNYTSYSGRAWPESKYFDLYDFGTTYNDDAAYARAKTGDATTETKGWYGDYAGFAYDHSPWFLRGGYCNDDAGAGVFAFGRDNGYSGIHCGFRPIVVQK